MKHVYLDNASTTSMRPEVIAEWNHNIVRYFGNPSSTHSFGRQAKSALENSRKTIAKLIGASSNEIIFTSGATESIHWILTNSVTNLGVTRIITTKIEHHAVLETIERLTNEQVQVVYLPLDAFGNISLFDLEKILGKSTEKTLVCLMHVNNEIGNYNNLKSIGEICKKNQAYFMSDTVQSIGKFPFNTEEISVDFMVSSAHKFNGPKGVGFLYKRKNNSLQPIYHGGEQEKGLRAGTENTTAILAMTTALEIAHKNQVEENIHIKNLKSYAINELFLYFEGVQINGDSESSSDHILNICLPFDENKSAMIVFLLDMKGIAISRGSACQSGSTKPSHVLAELLSEKDLKKPSIRISFSYQNTFDDIDALIDALKKI